MRNGQTPAGNAIRAQLCIDVRTTPQAAAYCVYRCRFLPSLFGSALLLAALCLLAAYTVDACILRWQQHASAVIAFFASAAQNYLLLTGAYWLGACCCCCCYFALTWVLWLVGSLLMWCIVILFALIDAVTEYVHTAAGSQALPALQRGALVLALVAWLGLWCTVAHWLTRQRVWHRLLHPACASCCCHCKPPQTAPCDHAARARLASSSFSGSDDEEAGLLSSTHEPHP